ncbi:MarR family winged helix-turn-helix transcriptional regulator [Massilia sp. YIM B04103]|uniref:MarR family winged helix-turn-helix transcriptional regulator n=1 Tax=Massilia sp. YIM B04103 TaxID=2963106 RepID=UPI00210BA2FD|nr:MarR family winged helix-turn-helix transcriptional regulator [Massilia sp. YIM B04103]
MPPEISNRISATVVAVFRANGRMLEWGDAFAAPFGLTSARWQILGAIALSPQTITTPRIAEQMGVSRQGAQKQLNLLLDDGLIEKLPNPGHRRSPHYRLTPSGTALFQQIDTAWAAHAQLAGQHFSAAELETTLRVLGALTDLHAMPSQGEQDEA